MDQLRSSLVEIVRDFLVLHRRMNDIFSRFQEGSLRYAEVRALVGDDESSLLFRLKERCHALFRLDDDSSPAPTPREALFDLAIGSLFHEAMKFKENLYQAEIYAPKVEALRTEAGKEADELFREFGRIIAAAVQRLDETLGEAEVLLAQTLEQFRLLLSDHRNNGLIVRCLIENAALVDEAFPEGLDALLAEVYGDAADAYLSAAHSYLTSACFREALGALAQTRTRSAGSRDVDRLCAYAEGMQAFLAGRYAESITRLEAWLDALPPQEERAYASMVQAAVSRVGHLVEGEGASETCVAAARLVERVEEIVGAEAGS